MKILERLLGRNPSPELEKKAARLLGIDPERPDKTRNQKVPEWLVSRIHHIHMLLGSNVSIGYETDEIRESWDGVKEYLDWAISRLEEEKTR